MKNTNRQRLFLKTAKQVQTLPESTPRISRPVNKIFIFVSQAFNQNQTLVYSSGRKFASVVFIMSVIGIFYCTSVSDCRRPSQKKYGGKFAIFAVSKHQQLPKHWKIAAKTFNFRDTWHCPWVAVVDDQTFNGFSVLFKNTQNKINSRPNRFRFEEDTSIGIARSSRWWCRLGVGPWKKVNLLIIYWK